MEAVSLGFVVGMGIALFSNYDFCFGLSRAE